MGEARLTLLAGVVRDLSRSRALEDIQVLAEGAARELTGRDGDAPSAAELALLQLLADSASMATENVQSRAALERLQKLAHDFTNVLSVILSYSQLMRADLRPGDPHYADIDEISRASERAQGLTRRLLAFHRQEVDDEERDIQPERGNETILLVDDDDSVRSVACQILRRNGHVVLEASNGGAAILIAEQHNATIHLLVTDVVLPRLGGFQIFERIRRLRPDIRVLFVSGYTDGTVPSNVSYLQKPITPAALGRKVRQVLDH